MNNGKMHNDQYKNNTISEQELIRYFEGNLSESEEEKVKCWITKSEENKSLAQEIYKITLAKDILRTVNELPAEEALKKVNRKIFSRQIKHYGKWIQQSAAILFIPLFLFTLFLLKENEGEEPELISFRTNPGIVADFYLPDGTKVWLNAHSTLTYPSRFKGDKRKVELTGEAYFKVKKDQDHPFIVDLKNQVEVEVTGTEFNIDAYDRSKFISAMLVSGSVKVHYPYKTKRMRTQTMEPGQKIVITKKEGFIREMEASALVETGWKDGKIYLENTPIRHLLHTLSKRYDVDFVLGNEELRKNRFTGTFGSQDLDLILKHLQLSSGIKHKIKMPEENDPNGRIIITLY
ncbi:MAG: DUF4974 domain-containing protein [Massilibacteroides sp.]|nr:DUF4974 domain-containing protein [Massilibacteroides sp.]MDD4114454.1 DUF4974 domain-containing protein [Massilibacteroides sp.]